MGKDNLIYAVLGTLNKGLDEHVIHIHIKATLEYDIRSSEEVPFRYMKIQIQACPVIHGY